MQQRLGHSHQLTERLEAYEMWIWRRMKQVSRKDRVTDANVLQRANETISILDNETRSITDTIGCRKHSWLAHVLRHDSLLKNIFRGKMTGNKQQEGEDGTYLVI